MAFSRSCGAQPSRSLRISWKDAPGGRADYARFVDIALGSAAETDYLLDLSRRLGALGVEPYSECKTCSNQILPALQKLLQTIEALEP